MNPLTTPKPKQISIFNMLLGFAILGILLLNIQVFGTTQTNLNQLIVNPHGGNYWLMTIINTFFGNKMVALLTLLFGASIALFFKSSKGINDISVPDLYIRRQLWLMFFGLINAVILLWQNDLLFPYSVVGILLFPLYRLSARALLIGAVIMALILIGKGFWDFSETKEKYEKYKNVLAYEKKYKIVKPTDKQLADTLAMKKIAKLSDEQKEDTTAWKGLAKMYKFDKKANDAEIKSIRSDYAEVWNYILPKTQFREAAWLYRYGLWDIGSLMLLGMALFKMDFFSNTFSTQKYAIWAIVGLGLGKILAWFSLGAYELQVLDFTKYVSESIVPLQEVLKPFERAFAAVGWASLIILFYRLGIMSWLWRALAAVGQMALSNYVIQTILCTMFFFGYGMGYFGLLKFYQLYFLVAEIWLLQLVFSVVWLRFYQYGPFEWLWHSLIRWQKQPMQIKEDIETSTSLIS
ncbi:DUF418 domain-containing protein [Emticicia sp. SJ17W-69]|uniref:DUF418 domain-containing protein n=1 Tax=Emticicia sp. SJ17W-69 TaxID=3421657 RepID=UPI003EBD39E2